MITGRLLRRLFGMREEYVVATKVHGRTMPGENGAGLSRKHVLASIDASLERLGLDYVGVAWACVHCLVAFAHCLLAVEQRHPEHPSRLAIGQKQELRVRKLGWN